MTRGKGQHQLIGICLPVVMSPQVSHQLISGIDILECNLPQEFRADPVQKCSQYSWTNLLCWQQPKKIAGASYCSIPFAEHHPALSNLVEKSTFPAPTIVCRRKKRAISGPIYFDDISILPSHRSNHPISHSVIFASKVLLHRNIDRNPLPYVALKKSPLRGPLYYS